MGVIGETEVIGNSNGKVLGEAEIVGIVVDNVIGEAVTKTVGVNDGVSINGLVAVLGKIVFDGPEEGWFEGCEGWVEGCEEGWCDG